MFSIFCSSRRRHTRFDCDWSSDVCSSDLFPRAAGEAVRNFQRALAALFVRAVPLDDERLAHMRKIEITVQFRGRPDLAGFDASVVWRGVLDKMRLAAIPEIELQGFQKTGLISFHRKIRSEEHTSELQSQSNLVCRLLL